MGTKWIPLNKKYKHKAKRRTPSLISQVRKLIREPKRNVEKAQNAILDISPAHASLDMMEEILSPPEIYVPNVEYVQRDDTTSLPTGNLQTFFRDLSKQAQIAWKSWTEGLDKSVEDLFLSDEEKILQIRYKRIVSVEDKRWEREQLEKLNRAISEVPGFRDTKPGVIERFKYSPSHLERAEMAHRTEFETNKARTNSLNTKDHLIANCGPRDDPDYLTSGDTSMSFNCIKPTSRVYNCIFKVFRTDGKVDLLFPNKKLGKDYTVEKDIVYMYKTKNIPIQYVNGEPKIQRVGPELFELDLRVSRGTELSPTNYKKLDPQSPAGIKIADLLDSQPHIWTETSWLHEGITKKVAYYLTIPHDSYGNITFWVYMDDRFVNKSNNPLARRKVKPHIRYIEQRCSVWPDRKLYQKLIAEVVYHEKFKRAAKSLSETLSEEYTFVKTTKDLFDVITDVYVRNDAVSKKDRDKFLLSKPDWETKYAQLSIEN